MLVNDGSQAKREKASPEAEGVIVGWEMVSRFKMEMEPARGCNGGGEGYGSGARCVSIATAGGLINVHARGTHHVATVDGANEGCE